MVLYSCGNRTYRRRFHRSSRDESSPVPTRLPSAIGDRPGTTLDGLHRLGIVEIIEKALVATSRMVQTFPRRQHFGVEQVGSTVGLDKAPDVLPHRRLGHFFHAGEPHRATVRQLQLHHITLHDVASRGHKLLVARPFGTLRPFGNGPRKTSALADHAAARDGFPPLIGSRRGCCAQGRRWGCERPVSGSRRIAAPRRGAARPECGVTSAIRAIAIEPTSS